MAQDEHLTPEKQLLKLIEDPKQETVQAEAAKRKKKTWFSLGALKGRLAFWKSFSFKKQPAVRPPLARSRVSPFGIRQLNLLLRVSILFLSVYLGYGVVTMGLELKKTANLIFQPERIAAHKPEEIPTLKSLSSYFDKVNKRDIFKLPQDTVSKEAWTPPPDEPSAKELLAKRLTLVGIAWSDNPEAMIEDTDQKKTHFVKRGEAFADSIQVVTIFRDYVVLKYKDEEVELK